MADSTIYMLTRRECDTGETDVMFVRAVGEWPARAIAAKSHGLEPSSKWASPLHSTCTALDTGEIGLIYAAVRGE